MKPSTLLEFLRDTAFPARLPVLIKGQPGIGKSDVVSQAAEAAGYDLIITHPVVSDPTDYKGLPFAADGRADFLPFGDLRQLIHTDRPTVYMLDDLGQAPPAVQAACMQLLLARRINGHVVSPEVTFVAATNRKQDRAHVTGILEPVKSRFASIIELSVDVDDWQSWALSHDIPLEMIAFVRFRPSTLTDWTPQPDIVNGPCPRTITQAARLWAAGIPAGAEYEVLSGAAGEGFAAEFLGFVKIWQSLPDPDAIIIDPMGAHVPTDIATLCALSVALARKATANTADSILQYAMRLEAEYSVLLVKSALREFAGIAKTRRFVEWAQKFEHVMQAA